MSRLVGRSEIRQLLINTPYASEVFRAPVF
jgi:hypothetical protein